ncbi:Transcriptional regulator, LytR family, partial [human gut metagenome]
LSSIIRDSYVTIPSKNKKDKINHAYAFGGPELTLET